jgi:hypothetical protein
MSKKEVFSVKKSVLGIFEFLKFIDVVLGIGSSIFLTVYAAFLENIFK